MNGILFNEQWNHLFRAIHVGAAVPNLDLASPLQVQIIDPPFDVTTSVVVPLLAAFFGAFAAFSLNWLERHERLRRERIETINRAIYSLLITNNTLLNFKRQFLYPAQEIKQALEIITSSDPFGDIQQQRDTLGRVQSIFNQIAVTDPNVAGILKQLEEIRFLNLTLSDELSFTMDGDVDILRFAILIESQLHQISKRISERNSERKVIFEKSEEELKTNRPGFHTLRFYHAMLDSHRILLEYVDLTLVLIDVTIEHLEKYRKATFRKRGKIAQRIFGKERWTSPGAMPETWRKLVPEREKYTDIIDGVRS